MIIAYVECGVVKMLVPIDEFIIKLMPQQKELNIQPRQTCPECFYTVVNGKPSTIERHIIN